MSTYLGITAQEISVKTGTGTDGNPQCAFTTDSGKEGRLTLLADYYHGAQPYFILERTEIEASQVFVPTRQVAPPQAVMHLGLEAAWFPAREQLMATDGLRLLTVTVDWHGTTQAQRRSIAEVLTRPYLKITKQGLAAAKGYP
jgi:hypothetical protein